MKIAFVVGEHSSDLLGAGLIRALRRQLGGDLQPIGLAGDAMAAEGVRSLFDIDELSIIGVGAVVARLPKLVRRLAQTTDFILSERPDALIVIDSYSFSHRIARRVRKRMPDLPIVNYVPPAVWAYHGERAAAMRDYIDRVISVFPFEPSAYAELGGPRATYVGHPLVAEPHLIDIMASPPKTLPNARPTLLLLPGSRRGEVERLIDDFGETLDRLHARMPGLDVVLPAVPRLADLIRRRTEAFIVRPQIVVGADQKWAAFAKADAALAASGTVALELALAGVPMVLCYKLDAISYRLRHWMTGWTAALPNYVVDHPLVPEHFHELVRPELLARRLERLLGETTERRAQLEGFVTIRQRMAASEPGEAAARIVLDTIRERRGSN